MSDYIQKAKDLLFGMAYTESDGEELIAMVTELTARADKMEAAIRAVLREPYGCRFCDSGKLRNPDGAHDEDCPYVLMRLAVWGEPEKGSE